MDGVSGASYGVPAIIMELGYRGIIVPADAQRARTICPACGDMQRPRYSQNGRLRTGSTEKTMRVKIISDTQAFVICHHCSPIWERITA